MQFIFGVIFVTACVLGGHSLHGELGILWQPVEVIIIVGAGVGAMVIGYNLDALKNSMKALKNLLKSKPYSKNDYMELLKLLFGIFKLMKVKGMLEIESHIENPKESNLFQESPAILADHHLTEFICDYLRLMTMGMDNPYHMEDLMNKELEIHHHESHLPGAFWTQFGESLPALGIVAAVLGVINSMGSITEPPEVLGGLIGAALVGTFLGILLSYGYFQPIGAYLSKYGEAESEIVECIKIGFISHLQGNSPTVTIEFIRKTIPDHERPSFSELDKALNGE